MRRLRHPIALVLLGILTPLVLGTTSGRNVDAASPIDGWSKRPTISNFTASLYNGVLTIMGKVTDPDDSPAGWTVNITGGLSTTATVQYDGWFSISTSYGGSSGEVRARTWDPHGAGSNTAIANFAE